MPHDIEYFRAKLHDKQSEMEVGTTFILTDIYGDWEGIDDGVRSHYGRLIREAVQKGEFPGLVYKGIASNRSNEYQVVHV